MFKDEYGRLFEDAAPSPELRQETLDLMAEAQAHAPILPPKKNRKPLILSLSLSGAAAVVALTVSLAFFLRRPEIAGPDQAGDLNAVLSGNSSMGSSKPEQPQEEQKQEPVDGAPAPGTSNPEENKGTSTPENQTPPTDDSVPQENEEQPKEENSTPPAPADPLAPIVVQDKNTETYPSIQAYLDALSAKKTLGYQKNYLADPALVLVPSRLPQQSRFRQLYAKSNGAYSYSYIVADGENQYFLEISVAATFPRTLRDLNLRLRGLKGEYEGMDPLENKRTYYFGNFEEVSICLNPIGEKPLPNLEETNRILADLEIDRYAVQNTLVQMTYD